MPAEDLSRMQLADHLRVTKRSRDSTTDLHGWAEAAYGTPVDITILFENHLAERETAFKQQSRSRRTSKMALGELELVGKGPEILREVYSDRLHEVDQSIHY